MKIDPSKLERQRRIAREFWNRGCVGSFLAATGFGKSFVAMMIIHALRLKEPGLSVLVVVPSDYLRDQWRDRLKEMGIERVRVDTVQNLVNEQNTVDFLVLDELHSYTSPVFSTIFTRVTYKYILGMTATLREDEDRNQILYQQCPVFDEVTLKECLEKGWVSPFVVYNYALELSETEMRYYKDLSGKFNKAFGMFGHDLNLAFSCLNDPMVRTRYAQSIKWEPKAVLVQASNMIRNMKKRKEFLYHYPGIIDSALAIINECGKGRKIISFSQSIESANELNEKLNKGLKNPRAMLYHSKLPAMVIDGKKYTGKKLKNKIIELYKSGKIDTLNTAKALDQGADIEDIDMSLVCSGTSSILQAIQRTGRNIRVKEDKQACEVNLFIRDTQSEKWLQKRLRKHPQTTIKYISNTNEIVL